MKQCTCITDHCTNLLTTMLGVLILGIHLEKDKIAYPKLFSEFQTYPLTCMSTKYTHTHTEINKCNYEHIFEN